MTILITGAAGFIGSNLCDYLIKHTDDFIIGIDNMSIGSSLDNLPTNHPHRFVFKVRCVESLDTILESTRPSAIIHCAAHSHVDRSIQTPKDFWQTNVLGTQLLLDSVVNIYSFTNYPKIINYCSDEVFGPRQKENPAHEHSPFNPTSPYAASKAAQYYVARSMMKVHQLPIINVFPCNVFGPRQYIEKIIPKFISLLLAGKQVPLMASTHFERTWMYTESHCEAIRMLLQEGVLGWNYNIGPGFRCSNQWLTERLCEICGQSKEKAIKIVPDRKIHDSSYAIDCNMLKHVGFYEQPSEVQFLRQLYATVEWYKQKGNNL